MLEPTEAERLHSEIQQWMSPPGGDGSGRIAGRQITRLLSALESSSQRDELHLSALAEAQFARRMLHAGCTLEFEAATPSGRHADFRVDRDGVRFYVHIKRLWVGARVDQPPLPAAFAALEQVPRALVIGIQWNAGAPLEALERMALEAGKFAAQASVGDALVVRGAAGEAIGECRVIAPHAGEHAEVRPEFGHAADSAIPRAQRLLRRAYGQFMPGAPNVICVVGDGAASAEVLDTALLGSLVERWDRFPPRGRRVAYGRAHDGFWARGQFHGSDLVMWLPVTGDAPAQLWRREGVDGGTRPEAVLREALGLGAAVEEPPTDERGYSSPTA